MRLLTLTNKTFNYKISGEQIYFAAFTICLCVSWIFSSMFMKYFSYFPFNVLLAFGILLFIFKIYLYDAHSPLQLILMSGIIALAAVSEIKAHSNLALLMLLMILASDNIDFDKIIHWYYFIGLIMLIPIILYSLLGIIPNLQFHALYRVNRYALGIVYPTDLSAHILYLMLADAYLHRNSLNILRYICYLVVICLSMKVTDGRLSFIASLMMLLVLFITEWAQKGRPLAKLITSIYWIAIPIEVFITIMASFYFDQSNHIFVKADNILSGRLFFSHEAFHKYGFSWFGQNIPAHGFGGNVGANLFNGKLLNTKYFYIDSSYVRLFTMYGICIALLIISFMIIIAIRATIHHDYVLAAILFVVSCSCMVEQHLLEISFNPFLLALLATQYPLEDNYEKL